MQLARPTLLVILSFWLCGCYLDIDVFGEGTITSRSGNVNCSGHCTENGGMRRRTESLIATPDEGHEFLGYLGDCSGTSCGTIFGYYQQSCGFDVLINAEPNSVSSADSVSPSSLSICLPFPTAVSKSVDAIFVEQGSVLEQSSYAGVNLCIINTDQNVDCWGRVRILTPNLTGATHISTEAYIACALHQGGGRCWGANPEGSVTIFDKLLENIPLSNPSSLWTTYDHACASDDDGDWCWGDEYQLQNRVPASIGIPTIINAGQYNTCVIEDGEAKCWGARYSLNQNYPSSLNNVSAIDFGRDTGCAIYAGNRVDCWGAYFGDIRKPSFPTLTDPTHIAMVSDGACVIDAGELVCSPDDVGFPRALSNPQKLASSGTYVCAMDDLGVVCSGGVPVPENITQPTDLAMSLGHREICAIDQVAGLICWENTNSSSYQPLIGPPPEGIDNPIDVDIAMNHACVINSDEVICWGNNDDGQLNVPPLSNPAAIAVGDNHSCAIDDTGVVCWGSVDQSATL